MPTTDSSITGYSLITRNYTTSTSKSDFIFNHSDQYTESKGQLGWKGGDHKLVFYRKLCETKVKNSPQDARAYYELGVLSKELKYFQAAEEMLKKSLIIDGRPVGHYFAESGNCSTETS